jgi:hypothetical protein
MRLSNGIHSSDSWQWKSKSPPRRTKRDKDGATVRKQRSIISEENSVVVIAIHPGEHLAEELRELGMSAAELARRLRYRNYGVASRAFLWYERGVLAELAESL